MFTQLFKLETRKTLNCFLSLTPHIQLLLFPSPKHLRLSTFHHAGWLTGFRYLSLTSSTAIISLRPFLCHPCHPKATICVNIAHISNQKEFLKKEFVGNHYSLTILISALITSSLYATH